MTRTTLTYVAVLCLLVVLAVVKMAAPEGPAPIAFKLPALKPDEVTKIVLTRGDQAVTLERDQAFKRWMVTAPFKYPADSTAVDGLLKNFEQEVTMDLKLTEDPKEHEGFEVTPDKAAKVEIYKGGELEFAILVGKNATGGSSYIRPVGSEEVFRAKVGSRSRYEKAPADWREKKIFDFEKETVTRLEISSVEPPLQYAFTQTTGKWQAEQPAGFPVDQMAVDSMARSLSTLRAADILEKADGDTGLQSPWLKVTAILASGPKTLLVGAAKPGADGKPSTERYAQREGDPQLFTVRESVLKTFQKSQEELRDKAIFDFDPEQISEITVSRGAKKVKLKLEGEGWKVVEPPGLEVDSKALQGMMASIATMRASAFTPGVSAADAGLEKDPLEVELGLKDGHKGTMRIGGEKGPGELYATRTDKLEVFTLREASVNTFKRILGEPVSTPKPGAPGMPPGMAGLPPGVQLPPGMMMQ